VRDALRDTYNEVLGKLTGGPGGRTGSAGSEDDTFFCCWASYAVARSGTLLSFLRGCALHNS